ncbi:hypothetical protein BGX27_005862 [Mortierella sp. AM989]|nr:hypothetical protein BGX27_005862 [Mortierella sp. AM989]
MKRPDLYKMAQEPRYQIPLVVEAITQRRYIVRKPTLFDVDTEDEDEDAEEFGLEGRMKDLEGSEGEGEGEEDESDLEDFADEYLTRLKFN